VARGSCTQASQGSLAWTRSLGSLHGRHDAARFRSRTTNTTGTAGFPLAGNHCHTRAKRRKKPAYKNTSMHFGCIQLVAVRSILIYYWSGTEALYDLRSGLLSGLLFSVSWLRGSENVTLFSAARDGDVHAYRCC
jgi:hypothetical protein